MRDKVAVLQGASESSRIDLKPPMARVRHGGGWPAEQRYIFDVLLGEHLGLQYETEAVPGLSWVEIDFPGIKTARVLRVESNLFLRPKEQWLTGAVMPTLPLEDLDVRSILPYWEFGSIPMLFAGAARPGNGPAGNGVLSLAGDIFGSAFFLLTRYEELVVKQRDRHERFSAKASLGYKVGFLSRPLVDEYSRLLGLALSACIPGFECRRHISKIRLSHDIDHPYQFFRKSVGHMAFSAGKDFFKDPSLRRVWGLARAGARSGFAGDVASDPFNSYESLMRAGEALGYPSEFYFMAGQRSRRYEEGYDLNKPELQDLLRDIHKRGHVIGLHASYDSFRSEKTLKQEMDSLLSSAKRAGLNIEAVGGRQHYLRWDNPVTWRAWEGAGLAYDATLGFADQVGFRCGTAREFPVFDVVESRKLKLRERPLVIMDVTMMDYMKLGPDEMVKQLRNLWATVKSLGGVMEVLIHNCNPQAAWLAEQVCSL